ncbi:MAG: (Fe-S)-binding protein [Promethearchaeota archaeon]
MSKIIELKNKKGHGINLNSEIISEIDLNSLLRRCYQCGVCSGVCQISKVQKYTPSRIIQLILEGFEDKVLESGVLWDCLTCNTCLQKCPQNINFADIVRIGRYKMQKYFHQNPDDYIAHKGIYTTISEIMCQEHIKPNRDLSWVPNECKISYEKGEILYYVGCLPYFNFEFDKINPIAESTIRIISLIENKEILILKEEVCCGHDLYWGQGKIEEFQNLAKKNQKMLQEAGVSTIITACAECYRSFKIDYPKYIEGFKDKFQIYHIIEYVYEKWKDGIIEFAHPNKKERIKFTFHDPCRLSRFLPGSNEILNQSREIFFEFRRLGYEFNEMEHNKENSLCCGVNSWMNCNEKSKALRYMRMLEAKTAGSLMLTACPKCLIHMKCIQNDYDNIASIEIQDFSEFLIKHIKLIKNGEK